MTDNPLILLGLLVLLGLSASFSASETAFFSLEGSERDRDKGLELGADAYLVKPFDPEELYEVAAQLLARAQQGG